MHAEIGIKVKIFGLLFPIPFCRKYQFFKPFLLFCILRCRLPQASWLVPSSHPDQLLCLANEQSLTVATFNLSQEEFVGKVITYNFKDIIALSKLLMHSHGCSYKCTPSKILCWPMTPLIIGLPYDHPYPSGIKLWLLGDVEQWVLEHGYVVYVVLIIYWMQRYMYLTLIRDNNIHYCMVGY